jgi:hypothetical protein
MIKRLNSNAIVPSGDTVRNRIFKSFENEKKKIKKELQEAPGNISFTLDGWTSKNQIPFLGITAHWISLNWELKNTVLDFKVLEGTHSGENIATVFFNILKEYGILNKVILFIIYIILFYFY